MIIVKRIKKKISNKEINFLIKIIKKENKGSIISSLSSKILKKYLKILVKSKNFFLFLCKFKDKNIGYSILCKSPKYLLKDFNKLKFQIIIELIFNIKILTILNILISISKIDLIFLIHKRKIINNNFNLSLLAITKKYQSKGIGEKFLKEVLKKINYNNQLKQITVETNNFQTIKFYEKKIGFKFLGKKLRFFKNSTVLYKKLI